MTLATSGFGSLFDTAYSGGGGGGTVIPNGGELDGVYSGNVYCEGDVNVVGTTTIKGSLFVVGAVIGAFGSEITVEGDVYSHVWNMDPDDSAVPQQNITVGGSFYYTDFYWPQCGGSSAIFRVGGSVYGTSGGSGSPFDAQAINNTGSSGASILVYGSWYSGDVNLDGADSDATIVAGSGGVFDIYGDVIINGGLRAQGGDGALGYDAGGGGSAYVYGNLTSTGTLDLDGGYGTDSDGGTGGYIDINGYLSSGDVRLAGGGGDNNGGNAGSIYINGSANIDDFWCNGGSGNNGNGGNGPTIDVDGDIVCDTIEIYGGNANVGLGGSGGNLYTLGSLTCSDFYAYGSGSNDGQGGNGAYISVNGNFNCDGIIEFYGGSGYQGSGGNGGTLLVQGDISSTYLAGYGGSCNSTNETHYAGYGGTIECLNLNVANNTIEINGGNRVGATLSPNAQSSSSNGGNIYADGSVLCDTLDAYGGSVSADYANRRGGDGGQLFISGDINADYIDITGGGSNGNDGGNGGYLSVGGRLVSDSLYSSGGNANASVDAAATVNGAASQNVSAGAGMLVQQFYSLDGSGAGSIPVYNSNIYLRGTCQFQTLSVADRPDSLIRPSGSAVPVVFQASSMPTKTTLNTWDGLDTTSGLSSDLATSIFTTSSTGAGDWYKITGVSAM